MGNGFLSFWTAASVVCVALAVSQAHAVPGKTTTSQFPQYKPGEVVVKLKSRQGIMSSGEQVHSMLNSLGKHYALTIRPFQTDKTFVKVKVDPQAPMDQVLADLKANPQVQYAEPNYIYHTLDMPEADPLQAVIPNDPNFGFNWGLLNVGQKDSKNQVGIAGRDIGATKAWAITKGSKDITVAVIDTGVDYNHEELKDNIMVNTAEIAGNGKDDDGNGFIDDVHGWNFEGKNNNPMDDNKHGTHCSGSIGARGNNGVGTAGVNWNVSILPIKFLSATGSGSLDDAVEAIKYATLMNVKVMSNSWGGGGASQTMYDAIKAARDKGILFVAAAGNEYNDNDKNPSYPASYQLDNVIAVAATDNRDVKSEWSNYGKTSVHFAAPGVNIYSTVPADKGGYDTLSGTSMACPHVAGAAALLWSANKTMTYAAIKSRLMRTVDPVRSLVKKTITGGRLNVYNALLNIVPPKIQEPTGAWKAMAKSIESSHPYLNNTIANYEVSHPGAKYIRLHFAKISTESTYDVIKVKSASGEVIETLGGEMTDFTTDYIEGDKVTVSFTSDDSNDGFGFVLDKYEFLD